MRVEQQTLPPPAADEVLINVRAIGVNPVEAYVRSGAYPQIHVPYTPGHDCAGYVEAVGKNADFKIGDRVFTTYTVSGSYAEKVLAPARDVHKLPEHLTFSQGAALGLPYGTAYRALFQRGKAKADQTVLIHGGSGGVGTAAIQLAKYRDLRIFATAGTDDGMRSCLEQGAALAFNHDQGDYVDKIREATGGRGVDLIIELRADINLDNDLRMLARHGRVVVVGARGKIEIDPRALLLAEADIRGMSFYSAKDKDIDSLYKDFMKALDKKKIEPLVGKVFRFDEAPAAHRALMTEPALGKIVLQVD